MRACVQNAVMDWRKARAEGDAIREERENRVLKGQDRLEHKRFLAGIAKTASACADCFAPLAAMASVTKAWRSVGIGRSQESFVVPICLTCWLKSLSQSWRDGWRGQRQRGRYVHSGPTPEVSSRELRRLRCKGCGRPLRIWVRWHRRITLRQSCCCEDCFRKATLRRANDRRRVHNAEMACAVCGEMFVPKKANAKTCSNRCRQRLFQHNAAKP
jgi:hypothetical protein